MKTSQNNTSNSGLSFSASRRGTGGMLRNYMLIAWRNLLKNKVFSAINIFGLAMGFTCCMLITLYIYQELRYDKHHHRAQDIYQLGTVFIGNDGEHKGVNTPAPMARAMQQEYPEIERTARLMRLFLDDKTLLQYRTDGKLASFYENGGYIADSSFFGVLTYKFLEGNPVTALSAPLSIVLSDEIARKIFGREPALNKTIHVSSSTNGDYDFTVTGVYQTGKNPSHIDARFFLSFGGGRMYDYMRQSTDMANNNMYYTYLLLRPDANAAALEKKFPAFIDKYARKDLQATGRDRKQFLIPVSDVHLRSDVPENVTPAGSPVYLYILGSIALLTLLIACINFMNLSTSRSSKRAAEVGVRKVLGAGRQALIRQFLGESLLLALIAFVIALVLAWACLPLFEQVSGKNLMLSLQQHGPLLILFLVLAIITGFIAGSYPAFYLSSFQPVRVLKGRFTNSLAAVSLRKGLVVFQFVISVTLIVASVIIGRQMGYLREKDLGFQKEQQVVLPLRSEIAKGLLPALRNELQRQPGIESIGASAYYPGIFNPMDWGLYREGSNMENAKRTFINHVDENYLQTLGIKPVAGRLFGAEFPGDTASNMIINEKAVKELGFKNATEAVGKWVAFDWQGEQIRFNVVGVVKDFHFKDLHVPIEPYAFLRGSSFNYLISRVSPGRLDGVLAHIGDIWKRLNPAEPFEYSFLDQDFQKNYRAEEQLSALIRYFTLIAIIISCLGLFGLASFSAEQRTKEIGIRKVLGASVANLVGLLSRDFMKLVAIAAFIAFPIAWYAMHNWLDNFAYRIAMPWVTYLLAALIALVIAFVTIAGHAIKAAYTNPVHNLRTE